MKSKHPRTYQEVLRKEAELSRTTRKEKQSTMFKYVDAISVSFSRMQVVKGLLYEVTVAGRPFSFIEDEGVSMAFNPILSRLKVKYNRHNIPDLIASAADHI